MPRYSFPSTHAMTSKLQRSQQPYDSSGTVDGVAQCAMTARTRLDTPTASEFGGRSLICLLSALLRFHMSGRGAQDNDWAVRDHDHQSHNLKRLWRTSRHVSNLTGADQVPLHQHVRVGVGVHRTLWRCRREEIRQLATTLAVSGMTLTVQAAGMYAVLMLGQSNNGHLEVRGLYPQYHICTCGTCLWRPPVDLEAVCPATRRPDADPD
ncbi:hypothetical protein Micbo1qcDRAFT_171138 [Microdochium bolleyi]|uniref:Uncharacterized protein n=1 Tax=Microdochium bolleyi TaxID=196109 RepID=A0A136JJX2_9PEZI|nr:hypothetical protein Micbo1qcDRAFT_171138 [Microdochium bolleyi]